MPSIQAKAFRDTFQATLEKGGRISPDDVKALQRAAAKITDVKEKSAANDVVALVQHDRILDEHEVAPARAALAKLLGVEASGLPAALEHVLKHAVPVPNVRVRSYDLSFDFSKDAPSFPARAVIALDAPPPAGAPAKCILEVDPDRLAIESVKVRGKRVPFTVKDGRLVVDAKGATTLDIKYRVTPTDDVDGYGLIRDRYANRLWTLTWPYNTGALFPSSSNPDDGATAKVTVRVGAGQKVAGPGKKHKDGAFHTGAPVPAYAIGFTAGKISDMRSAVVDGYEARTVGLGAKMSPSTRKALRESVAETMAWASRKFGECVFGKVMNIVEIEMDFGGMEHAGAIAIGVGQSKKDTIEAGVHETMHHWFGDGIRIKHWGELWMSEGFTDYTTWRFFGQRDGDEAMYRYFDDAKKELADQLKKGIDQPLDEKATVDPEEGLSWVPYMQGAWMLRMIEAKIGTEKIDALLRDWFQAEKGDAVSTKDFIAFAEVRGIELQSFFDAWKELKSIPTFQADKTVKGSVVDVELTPKGDVPKGIAIPLRIVGKHGETKDVVVAPGKRMHIDAGFAVKSLEWDPDRHVLCDVK